MKKLLVSLLCVVMMATFMPSMAFADASGVLNDAAGQPLAAEDTRDKSETEGEGGAQSNGIDLPENNSEEDITVVMTQNKIETKYASVNDAIAAAAENGTDRAELVLQKDVTEDVVIEEGTRITLYLNGHTLMNKSGHTIHNKSKLTYIYGGATKSDTAKVGTVDNVSHAKAAVYNDINASMYIYGGNFTRSQEASTGDTASGGNSYYVMKNYGYLMIEDGVIVKFSDSNPGLYSSLIGSGWQDAAAAEAGKNGEPKPSDGGNKATLTINGGTFTGGQITIKNDDYGVLTVSGGTIVQPSDNRVAIANNNTATISGGTIEAKGANGQAVYSRYFDTNGANTGKLTISGGTLKSTGNVVQAQNGSSLEITGGVFETTDKDVFVVDVQGIATAVINSGRYIGTSIDKIVNKDGVFAEEFAPKLDTDGSVIVDIEDTLATVIVVDKNGNVKNYKDLASAFSAAKAGSTVKLQKDIVLERPAKTGAQQGITFDLNGCNIDGTATKGYADGVVYMVAAYGWKPIDGIENKMSVINSRPEEGGEIKGELPLTFGSGDSSYRIAGEVGEGVKLVTLDTNADAVRLKSSAYLVYSDTTKDLIKNGGFKITDAQGTECIYGAYANARNSAVDGVVTMLHDYKGNEAIYSGSEEGILDLGGNTYTYTSTGSVIDVNSPNVTFTIKNGKIIATDEACDGAHLVGAGESQMNNRGIILDGVELTVPGEAYGIVTNGTETGNKVVLKNSVLNVKEGYGIYFPSTGEVIIDNSIINAKHTGVQMCAGTLSVTGEKTAITVTGQPQEKTETDGPISDGAAISIVERDGYKELGTVKIEGGAFKSAEGVKAVKAYTFNNTDKKEGSWPEANEVVTVTGGTFSDAESVKDFIPNGMDVNEEGTVVTKPDSEAKIGTAVYATLEDALAAAEEGDTVTLLKSVELNKQLNITKSITLDGAGNTLKVRIADFDSLNPGERAAVFVDGADVNVTIKEITIDGPCADTSEWISGAHTLKVWGGAKITLSNATLTNGMEAMQVGRDSEATLDGKINFTGNMHNGIELVDGGNADTVDGDAVLTVNEGTEFVNKDTKIWKNNPDDSDKKLPVEENITDNSGNLQFDDSGNLIDVVKPVTPPSGGGTVTPSIQKPIIEAEDGATVTLSKDGTTATIVIDKDATLKDVLLNGESLGAVTEVKNLKTGDKLVVVVETLAEKNARLKAGVENTTIKLKSTLGKGYIKLNWTKSEGYKVDKYQVFRSTKRYSGYGTKAYFTTKQGGLKAWYKNTKELKKGNRYYYKVRGVREIAGKTVYTQWSNKAWRLVK